MLGFFDSGAGGIYVMAHCIAFLKNKYIYFADTKNAPFGSKSREEIQKITAHAVEFLISKGADTVVIACNTATAQAIDYVRNLFPVKIIGTEPAVLPAVKADEQEIAVLATPKTLESARYKKLRPADGITDVPCPNLAAFVENNLFDTGALQKKAAEIDGMVDKNAALVLGCTHYLAFKPYLAERNRKVFDSNDGILNIIKQNTQYKGKSTEINIYAGERTDDYEKLLALLLKQY